jgi:serine phosphatase RsbU (regulator of sigma subunit)/anti-sigma regulatory factor (Ser/Thr protein kinase)
MDQVPGLQLESFHRLWNVLTGGDLKFLSEGEQLPARMGDRDLPARVERAYLKGGQIKGAVLDGAMWWVILDTSREPRNACVAWSTVEGPWDELLNGWMSLSGRIESEKRLTDELTHALVNSWDRLTLLYELMQIAGEPKNLSWMLQSVVTLLAQVAAAGDVFLVLDEGESTSTLTASGEPLPNPRVLVQQAAQADRPLTLAELHRNLRQVDSPLADARDLLVTSLTSGDAHFGVVGLLDPEQGSFEANDVQLIASVAEQVASLIQAERSRAARAEQQLLEHELSIAAQIQSSLLPDTLPELPGLEIGAMLEPARQVGGDFFDVSTGVDGNPLLLLADVSGKGSPAALLTALLHAAFLAEAAHSDDPGALLAQLNRLLYRDLDKAGSFITAFVVKLDAALQRIEYASAGHVDAAYWLDGRQTVVFLPATGLPLGVERDEEYRSRTIGMTAGNALWIYSDGITEARGVKGELFGGSGLVDLIQAAHPAGVQAQIRLLQAYLETFHGDAALEDDIAVTLIRATLDEDPKYHVMPFVLPATMEAVHEFVSRMREGRMVASDGDVELSQDDLDDMALAVSEIASNQVEHAYEGAAGIILGRFVATQGRLEVHLFDRGIGFDLEKSGLPVIDKENPPERGYGLRLAFGLLDECEMERSDDGRNHWRLVKEISEKSTR